VKGRKIFRFFSIAISLIFFLDFSGGLFTGRRVSGNRFNHEQPGFFSAGLSCRSICTTIMASGFSPGIGNNYYQMIFPE